MENNNTLNSGPVFDPAYAEKIGNENVDVFNTKLSLLKIHREGSVKSKTIMALAVIGMWIPFIPSVVALLLVPSAKREAGENKSSLFLTRWGKIVSWVFLVLNIAGTVLLFLVLTLAGDVFREACQINDAIYCEFVE